MSSVSSGVAGAGAARFRVGSALSRAFQVYGAGVVSFFVLTLIPMAPLLIVGLVGGPGGGGARGLLYSLLRTLLLIILQPLATAACLYGAYQVMRGRTFSVGDSLRAGWGRLGAVVGASLLVGLLGMLAFLLLIIPGIIVFCALYVALPACVIERLGARASLRRSRDLTRGSRWPIFGLLLLVGVASAVLGAGAGRVGAMVGDWILLTIAYFTVQVIAQSFGAVLSAVVYHDLRVAKEGVDIDTIASVFD
jgi:hypothetical protein